MLRKIVAAIEKRINSSEILELDEKDDFREDPGVLSESSLDSILFNAVSTFGVETVCKSGCVTVSTLYKMRCVFF